MAEVSWPRRALREIEAVVGYTSPFNPVAAQRLFDRLTALGESLAESPERGRTASRDRRELVTVLPYVLRDRIVGHDGVIERVRHSARRPL